MGMGLFKLLPPKLRQRFLVQGLIALVKQGQAQHLGQSLKVYLLSKKEDDLSDEAVLMILGEVATALRMVAAELEA